jgi:hypothetical protein
MYKIPMIQLCLSRIPLVLGDTGIGESSQLLAVECENSIYTSNIYKRVNYHDDER